MAKKYVLLAKRDATLHFTVADTAPVSGYSKMETSPVQQLMVAKVSNGINHQTKVRLVILPVGMAVEN